MLSIGHRNLTVIIIQQLIGSTLLEYSTDCSQPGFPQNNHTTLI